MKITIEKLQGIDIAVLQGDTLDAHTTKEFKKNICPILAAACTTGRLVLDLGQLTFIDSSGIGALISCLSRMNAKSGQFCLCGVGSTIRGAFEMVNLDRIMPIHATREAAVASILAAKA